MTTAALMRRRRSGRLSAWLLSVVYGALIGCLGALLLYLGLLQGVLGAVVGVGSALYRIVGPVWLPMALIAVRVGWLAARALRTRLGRVTACRPVRDELHQLAPLFVAFGLAGTVWGLTIAFDALRGDAFIEGLPQLLSGLGAAMTSTLVGLSFQIGTLLVAAYNPTWSRATVYRRGDVEVFHLDDTRLGEGDAGLSALFEALGARAPEALHIELDPALSLERRIALHGAIWRHLDGAIPVRPPVPSSARPSWVGARA